MHILQLYTEGQSAAKCPVIHRVAEPERDGQKDGQTDGMPLTITALCIASNADALEKWTHDQGPCIRVSKFLKTF